MGQLYRFWGHLSLQWLLVAYGVMVAHDQAVQRCWWVTGMVEVTCDIIVPDHSGPADISLSGILPLATLLKTVAWHMSGSEPHIEYACAYDQLICGSTVYSSLREHRSRKAEAGVRVSSFRRVSKSGIKKLAA